MDRGRRVGLLEHSLACSVRGIAVGMLLVRWATLADADAAASHTGVLFQSSLFVGFFIHNDYAILRLLTQVSTQAEGSVELRIYAECTPNEASLR